MSPMLTKTFAVLATLALTGPATAEPPPPASGDVGRAIHGADAQQHMATFDTLDFDVISNKRWERLGESHTADVTVTWPDGHETHGLEKHARDLAQTFPHAPDAAITQHPIRIALGEWTAVTAVMSGTFSLPMRLANGTVIQPTGKRFSLPFVTIGHWTDGRMDHEWLYWDSMTYMRQIGLAK